MQSSRFRVVDVVDEVAIAADGLTNDVGLPRLFQSSSSAIEVANFICMTGFVRY